MPAGNPDGGQWASGGGGAGGDVGWDGAGSGDFWLSEELDNGTADTVADDESSGSDGVGDRSPIVLAGGFAKDQLQMSVEAFASGHCQGRVFRRLPSQFLGMSISKVMSLAKGGNSAARSCIKILSRDEYRK